MLCNWQSHHITKNAHVQLCIIELTLSLKLTSRAMPVEGATPASGEDMEGVRTEMPGAEDIRIKMPGVEGVIIKMPREEGVDAGKANYCQHEIQALRMITLQSKWVESLTGYKIENVVSSRNGGVMRLNDE